MEWGKSDPLQRVNRELRNLEDRANGLWQLIQDLKAALGANETQLSPTGAPTFARVITPRVDNNGGNLKINPTGGNISIGQDSDLGKRLGIKANNGEEVHRTYNGSGYGIFAWGVDADGDGEMWVANKTGGLNFQVTGSGFTKMGANDGAPGTKKWYTEVTLPSTATSSTITIPMANLKIVDIQFMMRTGGTGGGEVIPPTYGANNEAVFKYYFYCPGTNNRLTFGVPSGASASISRVCSVIIEYQE